MSSIPGGISSSAALGNNKNLSEAYTNPMDFTTGLRNISPKLMSSSIAAAPGPNIEGSLTTSGTMKFSKKNHFFFPPTLEMMMPTSNSMNSILSPLTHTMRCLPASNVNRIVSSRTGMDSMADAMKPSAVLRSSLHGSGKKLPGMTLTMSFMNWQMFPSRKFTPSVTAPDGSEKLANSVPVLPSGCWRPTSSSPGDRLCMRRFNSGSLM
mmetsp:Transcript_36426/g.89793  ORF Transcript_36426/g.89793 Transcript_36426/m.89793 type:complete len:209 (-) Transcript_36426:438-1064(-)